jgi:hypothetical protein
MPDMPSEPPHCRNRLTLKPADLLGDLGQHDQRLFDRFARAAGFLDVEMAFSRSDTLLAIEGELVDLAAEPDHQHAAKIRMAGVAGQRAVQHHHAVAGGAHPAALAVNDGNEAVDAGISRQERAVRLVGDGMANGGRAIDAGENADEVARAGTAVGATVAHEGAGAVGLGRVHGFARRHHRQTPGLEDQIVRMDMLAGYDVLGGAADRLSVFDHGLAGGDRLDRYLVAGFDQRGGDGTARQYRADLDAAVGDRDIVGGGQKNAVCGVHGQFPGCSWDRQAD